MDSSLRVQGLIRACGLGFRVCGFGLGLWGGLRRAFKGFSFQDSRKFDTDFTRAFEGFSWAFKAGLRLSAAPPISHKTHTISSTYRLIPYPFFRAPTF